MVGIKTQDTVGAEDTSIGKGSRADGGRHKDNDKVGAEDTSIRKGSRAGGGWDKDNDTVSAEDTPVPEGARLVLDCHAAVAAGIVTTMDRPS